MAGLLSDRKGKAALIALILGLLSLSVAPTLTIRPDGRSSDGQLPAGYAGLRPDWVRLSPATPVPPATVAETAVPTPERREPTPTPAEPMPTAEAPSPVETAPPSETIAIAAVSPPTEAPPSATAAAPPESTAPPPAFTTTEGLDLAFAGAIVELTNQARLASGLTPLAEHLALVAAAQEYADLHAHVSPDRLDHGLNGSTLDSRAEAEGYAGWTFLAENLVWSGFDPPLSPEEAVQQWLASPAHRDNLLNPTIEEMGVGCYVSAAARPFRICVQEFGARP